MKKLSFSLMLMISLLAAYSLAAEYPNRPIEIIVPFPPGGSTDPAFRIIQPGLQAALGVPVVLTSKPGAAGALGTEFVAKGKSDGYTLLAGTNSSLIVAPAVNPSITYRHSDFIPACIFATDAAGIISKLNTPWKNLEELLDYARKNPGKLSYGATGMGTVSFFTMEIFKLSNDLDIVPVQFQGTGPVKNAILGGHVDLASATLSPFYPLAKAKQVTLLVTTAPRRMPDIPDVPTMAEKGMGEGALGMWSGIFVPKKCPPEVVEKINKAMDKVMQDPKVEAQLSQLGFFIEYKKTQDTLEQIARETAVVDKVVKKLGMGKDSPSK
jgi:tripartite-type tricarboxylate transporter receptor subunit TctC